MVASAKLHSGCSSVSTLISIILSLIIGQVYHAKEPTPEWVLDKRPTHVFFAFAMLYPIFLAILKYRAAHHRKIRKINNGSDCSSRLRAYLKEMLLCEAKVTFVSHPLLPEIWSSLTFILAWILFPRPLALVYVLIFGNSTFFHMLLMAYQRDFVDNAKSFLYNGQRYKYIREEMHYSCFKDENKSTLYYATLDIYGLVSLDS